MKNSPALSQSVLHLFLVGFLALGNLQCTKKTEAPAPADTTASAEKKERVLNLAIWGNYLAPEQEAEFHQKTGIKLEISHYSSNEELLAKVQSGAAGFDVAVPSDYMVGIMTKLNLLAPLDHAQIPNEKNIEEKYLKQSYDPSNTYSLPYAFTITGIAINTELYKKKLTSWKEFFHATDLKGKVALLDDVREVLGAALKANGNSLNATEAKQVLEAKNLVKKFKPQVKMFRSDLADALTEKEVAVAQAYSSDGVRAWKASDKKIQFVIPEDGGSFAIDNVVLLKDAEHVKEAHELINYLMTPEVDTTLVQNVYGGAVIKGVREKLPPELRENEALFPNAKAIQKMEHVQDLGDQTALYEKAWVELKSE